MVSPQTPLPLIAQTDSSGTWVGWNRHVDSCHRTWHQKSVTQYYSIRLKRLKKGQLARLTQVPNLGSSRIQHEAESKSITLLVEQGADANVQVLQAGIDILKRNKIPSLCFARKQHWIKSKQQTRSFKTGLLPKFTLISQQKCQIVVGLQILMSAESKRSRLNATAAHSHYGIHKCRAFLSKINLHKPSKQNEQKTMCWLW